MPKLSQSDKVRKTVVAFRYSPLMEHMSRFKAFKMKNTLKPLKTSLTPYLTEIGKVTKAAQLANKEFRDTYNMANDYTYKLKQEYYDNNLQKEVNKIKQETLSHCKRLEKKKKEELDKGSHEYANYIVSMINSSYVVD